MTDRETQLDSLVQQIPRLAPAAAAAAHRQALPANQRVLVSGDGGIYEIGPDGRHQFAEATGRPLSAPCNPLPGARMRTALQHCGLLAGGGAACLLGAATY